MSVNKRRSIIGIAILIAALVFMGISQSDAAVAIDTSKQCTITISLSGGSYAEDLKGAEIPVKLYKVADVSKNGTYTAVGDFQELDVSSVNKEAAGVWEQRAKDAEGMVKSSTEAAKSGTMTQGSLTMGNIPVGLYLVLAKGAQGENKDMVQTSRYEYQFTPYLISLPNNYYASTGNDAWVYDLNGTYSIGLKPMRQPRYGSVKITKRLQDINETMGSKATFVYQVKITTPEEKTQEQIHSINFDSTGSKSAVINKIPAESEVEITEVYSGAGYEVVGDKVKTIDKVEADKTKEVHFTNKHDNKFRGGYGINNHFKQDESGQYQYDESVKDSTNK